MPDRAAAPAAGASPAAAGATTQRLRMVRGFVFDMDGTLVLGDRHNRGLVPLPGALEITRWVTRHEDPATVRADAAIHRIRAAG